jgi:hypothetical protein
MVKALVAIEVNLASSFAIRYACQLSGLINMEIHPVYVKFPSPEAPMTGVGWVRHTWEREVVEMGKAEIQEMLASETESCPVLQEPRVIYGDREQELLRIMQQEVFGLYIEGAPYPFAPAAIYQRLRAKFYQTLPCPLIWLRGMRKIAKVLALCSDPAGAGAVLNALERLWQGCPTPVHLAYPAATGVNQDMAAAVAEAGARLEAKGCRVILEEPFKPVHGGPPLNMVQDFGLAILALKKGAKKDDPQFQYLAQVKVPLMLLLV